MCVALSWLSSPTFLSFSVSLLSINFFPSSFSYLYAASGFDQYTDVQVDVMIMMVVRRMFAHRQLLWLHAFFFMIVFASTRSSIVCVCVCVK